MSLPALPALPMHMRQQNGCLHPKPFSSWSILQPQCFGLRMCTFHLLFCSTHCASLFVLDSRMLCVQRRATLESDLDLLSNFSQSFAMYGSRPEACAVKSREEWVHGSGENHALTEIARLTQLRLKRFNCTVTRRLEDHWFQ